MCDCTGPTHEQDCKFRATAETLKKLAERAWRRFERRRGSHLAGEAERLWHRLDELAEAVATPYVLRPIVRLGNKPWAQLVCRCGAGSWVATQSTNARGPAKWHCARCWRAATPRQNHILNKTLGREAR